MAAVTIDSGDFPLMRNVDVSHQPNRAKVYNDWLRAFTDQVPEAIIVPEQALALRNDQSGVFVVSEDGRSVSWQAVKVGFREGNRVQVEGQGLTGRVVTLGQQLVKDGSRITIPVDH
jgi:multidrug efflux pump subunit AcrA (membrane-fusion protein)